MVMTDVTENLQRVGSQGHGCLINVT